MQETGHPALILAMLPRISEAGFIAELRRHSGAFHGYIQHRWIFCMKAGELLLVSKIPLVEYLHIDDEGDDNNAELQVN